VYQNNKEICKNCAVKQVFEKGINAKSENQLTSSNGSIKYYETYAYPVYNKQGEIAYAVETTIDITTREQSEEALKESEEKHRLITTNTLDTIWTTDLEFKITFVNDAILKFLGYTPEEFIGLKPSVFTKPEGIKTMQNVAEQLVTKHKEGDVKQSIFEVQQIKKDGTLIDVEIRANLLLNSDEKFIGFQGRSVDITERKQDEDKLLESEERYRTLVEDLQDVIVRFSLDGKILYCSQNVKKFGGFDPDEEIGQHFSKYIVDEQKINDLQKIFQNIITTKETTSFEFQYKPKNKKPFYVETTASPNFSESSNEIISIQCIIRDITERKQAKNALIESEEKLSTLMNATSDVAGLMQNDGTIVMANKALENSIGTDELIGRKLRDILPSDIGESRMLIIRKIIESKKSLQWEDGRNGINYLNSSYPIFDDSGNVKFIAFFGKNITAQKKAEKEIQKLSTAVTQSPSVIAITDKKGNMEYVNPKFTELTGYTLEEAKGKNPRILKSGEQADEIYKELWKTISSGKEWHGEFHNKKKNGELFWEAASVSPILNKQGKIINYLKVAEDITERKQVEDNLKQRMQELEIFNDATVNRELKIIELKKEINKLLEESGKKPQYKIVT
ncbi:MAG: PAS domain S-box protein, partial [Bacteroidota bacterium]|nr:PAS domain S-box protein [Bacteroidota bacterium]